MERLSNSLVFLLVSTLVIVSAVILPVALWPNYGETPYFLDASPVDEDGTESGVIEYENLPPVVQESFNLSGQSEPMYIGHDHKVQQLLTEKQYVRYEGQLYRISLYHGDAAWIYVTVLRYGLFAIGSLLAITGLTLTVYSRLRESETSSS